MAEQPAMIRAFVALDFPPAVKAAVSELLARLTRTAGHISWITPRGVHLTLKFLGNIPVSRLEGIKRALRAAVENIAPFNLQLGGLGLFPDQGQPRVIWWGLASDSSRLGRLAGNLERELAKCGFVREKRPFTPHLTLGRIRRLKQPARQLRQYLEQTELPACPAIEIKEVVLMQSTLSNSGAVYDRLASFPLKGRQH